LHLRFNDLDDPRAIRAIRLRSVFESDMPIIVQHTRSIPGIPRSRCCRRSRILKADCAAFFIDAAVNTGNFSHCTTFASEPVLLETKYENCTDRASHGERAARLYGGSERIVSYLTDELVRQVTT